MGAQASSSCATERDTLEQVVNVCCRDDKNEFTTARYNVYQTERDRYLLDADRKGSKTVVTSKWRPRQQSDAYYHHEICCGREMEEAGQRSLISNADHGNNPSRRNDERGTGLISGADKTAPRQAYDAQSVIVESSENHHRMPAPPPGWTESEMLLLKSAVERAARTLRIKQPGFAAMQAIHTRSHLRILIHQLETCRPCLRLSVLPKHSCRSSPCSYRHVTSYPRSSFFIKNTKGGLPATGGNTLYPPTVH
jgi:hypothetical protein